LFLYYFYVDLKLYYK